MVLKTIHENVKADGIYEPYFGGGLRKVALHQMLLSEDIATQQVYQNNKKIPKKSRSVPFLP